jgi:Domain of unknown function (DUF6265)
MIARLSLIALCALAAPARADAPDASRLAWLEGRWTGTQDGIASEEIWTSPAGGALIGMHKDVQGGRMVGFEYIRIEKTAAEGLVYVASPRGGATTRFKMVELSARRVVFANPGHDFPQRILYWLDERGALHARIEGRVQGVVRGQEWVWTRAAARPR